jgi:integrase
MARHGENIYRRKDKRWEGRYKNGVNANGLVIYGSVYGRTYTECKTKLKAAKAARQRAKIGRITLLQAATEWLGESADLLKKSSLATYRYNLDKYIYPYLGNRFLDNLNEDAINIFIKNLLRGSKEQMPLSLTSIRLLMSILNSIFKYAEKHYHIINVCSKLSIPKLCRRQAECLTDMEWAKILIHLQSDRTPIKFCIALSLFTGMRLCEICALKAGDFDFAQNIIRIARTVQRVHNYSGNEPNKTLLLIDTPKSINSQRIVPMPQPIAEWAKEEFEYYPHSQYIFSMNDKPLEPRYLQYQFKHFLQENHMRDMNFHILRHSFATKCIEKGVDMKSLSEILGHASVTITLDRYVHSTLDFKRSQIEKIAN